ncbi:MAG TPA: hypothetical protein VHQ23_08285 [Ilumatobacteraceae bacterium]|nr:hypothetical protein [Ilumatobacteraceae bacterium]
MSGKPMQGLWWVRSGYFGGMTKQRGEDPPPRPSDDDASPGEFIDKPQNLPGDQDKKPAPGTS